MDRKALIESRLSEAFNPFHLEVVDESSNHDVPEGAQSHFKVTLVSAALDGLSLVQRHRRINQLLADQFSEGLHALALHTYTPEEWFEKGGQASDSPPCLGGGKAG